MKQVFEAQEGLSMQRTITPIWSETMYKGQDLAELTFDEAIDRELLLNRSSEDVVKTTIHIPLWVRASIARKHAEMDVSEGKLYTAIINHGTSIIKTRYKDRIRDMEGVRYKLLKSDNDIIKSLVGDFQICVNGVQGGKDRRTVRVPAWCKDYLGTVGAAFRMEFSSMVRLALYLAFQTNRDISKKDMRICKTAISNFEYKLKDYSTVCIALVATEE